MDFVERIFHFAPDGGNGFIEFMLLLGVMLLSGSVVWRVLSHRTATEFRLRAAHLSQPFRTIIGR